MQECLDLPCEADRALGVWGGALQVKLDSIAASSPGRAAPLQWRRNHQRAFERGAILEAGEESPWSVTSPKPDFQKGERAG